jgi:hypothetical protein
VNWEQNRIHVRSPKTEHHSGGGSRVIPLFPELRPHLELAFDQASPGSEFVITSCRDATKNLRTQFRRIIERAGLKVWPKPFQNLRSTRETELAETYPMHVVCEWIGNSQPVAAKHYLQVTKAHFDQASEALQNPVQQLHETDGNGSQVVNKAQEKTSEFAEVCDLLPSSAVNSNSPAWTRNYCCF